MSAVGPFGPRYDWAPVDKLIAQRWPELGRIYSEGGEANGSIGLSELLGMRRNTLHASRKEGRMTSDMADRVATKLGVHACLIWPTWFDDADEEPRCRWCGIELGLGTRRITCSDAHRVALNREIDQDRWRLEKFENHCNRTRARLEAMTPTELDAWLGIETDQALAA